VQLSADLEGHARDYRRPTARMGSRASGR
jgi:hypothetical protein